MATKPKEIQFEDVFNDKKRDALKRAIAEHAASQSKEQLLASRLLSIQYKLQDYVENESDGTQILKILDFVKMYLKELNMTKKELASAFGMRDSNLHKYLSGERKLNAKLALKLGSFSHTKPEYWYRVEVKNELIELNKEKENMEEYEKYDYRNLIAI